MTMMVDPERVAQVASAQLVCSPHPVADQLPNGGMLLPRGGRRVWAGVIDPPQTEMMRRWLLKNFFVPSGKKRDTRLPTGATLCEIAETASSRGSRQLRTSGWDSRRTAGAAYWVR